MIDTPILRIALPVPLRRLFDYLPPQGIDYKLLKPGIRVSVPFQSRQLVGLLISVEKSSSLPYEKLKKITEILDEQPILSADVYKLCQWAAEYYHYAFGEVLTSALPVLLRKNKSLSQNKIQDEIKNETRDETKDEIKNSEKNKIKKIKNKNIKENIKEEISATELPLQLNAEQQLAVNAISAAKNNFKVFLLDGVTGSGKTEVYLHAMAENIKLNKQILMLVPEISLTPQTIERLRSRFSVPIVAIHSNLSEKKRFESWQSTKNNEAKILIGTRSAIFTPFTNLGLIIVDEEHDSSFKQQDRFRYHARDLAIMRGSFNNIPIVLGSATPSLESLLNAKRKRYELLTLSHRAGNAQLPQYQMIDLRKSSHEEGLSQELLTMIKHHLDQQNQVMLFLNRRGFSPVLYCTQCTAIVECKRCDARMVYHKQKQILKCHHCDARKKIPTHCEKCNAENLQPVGIGTQRLEQTLLTHFPDVPILRVDRDNTQRKGDLKKLLDQINTKQKAILLGTQMLAKGHHFPQVTLVGIIDADAGLFSSDFRAAEQMGQLLMQVSGRAGREDKPGSVMIQTRHPEHPLLQTLVQYGYQQFAQTILDEREIAVLPPFSYFAVFKAEAYHEENAIHFLQEIKKLLPGSSNAFTILGPVPALMSKRKGLHCQHLLMKTEKRSTLQHTIKNILSQLESLAANYSVKWILDVDPVEV